MCISFKITKIECHIHGAAFSLNRHTFPNTVIFVATVMSRKLPSKAIIVVVNWIEAKKYTQINFFVMSRWIILHASAMLVQYVQQKRYSSMFKLHRAKTHKVQVDMNHKVIIVEINHTIAILF